MAKTDEACRTETRTRRCSPLVRPYHACHGILAGRDAGPPISSQHGMYIGCCNFSSSRTTTRPRGAAIAPRARRLCAQASAPSLFASASLNFFLLVALTLPPQVPEIGQRADARHSPTNLMVGRGGLSGVAGDRHMQFCTEPLPPGGIRFQADVGAARDCYGRREAGYMPLATAAAKCLRLWDIGFTGVLPPRGQKHTQCYTSCRGRSPLSCSSFPHPGTLEGAHHAATRTLGLRHRPSAVSWSGGNGVLRDCPYCAIRSLCTAL